MGNARKLQELNCSISVENEAQLESAILEIEEKREFYRNNVKKINEYSRKFKGIEKTVDVIEGIL
jgi:hypothetical protein